MAFKGSVGTQQPSTPAVAPPKEKPARVQTVLELFDLAKKNIHETVTSGPKWGLKTGFPSLDAITFGLQDGCVYTIAGRPGSGKTALQNEICFNVALEGHPVLLFSMEMNGIALLERLLANKLGITLYEQKMGTTPAWKLAKIDELREKVSKMRFEICDKPAVTVSEMMNAVEWFKEKYGVYPALIGTDYVQLMSPERNTGAVRTDIVDISKAITELARLTNIPVIQVAQCSRKCEDREDKRPVMSDLAESGQIEQDSHFIAFVYRDEYYNKASKMKGVAEIIVRKNRGNKTDTLMMGFIGEQFKFTNDPPIMIDQDEEAKIAKGWHPFMED